MAPQDDDDDDDDEDEVVSQGYIIIKCTHLVCDACLCDEILLNNNCEPKYYIMYK